MRLTGATSIASLMSSKCSATNAPQNSSHGPLSASPPGQSIWRPMRSGTCEHFNYIVRSADYGGFQPEEEEDAVQVKGEWTLREVIKHPIIAEIVLLAVHLQRFCLCASNANIII